MSNQPPPWGTPEEPEPHYDLDLPNAGELAPADPWHLPLSAQIEELLAVAKRERERLRELEAWFGLLVVLNGRPNGMGWQLRVPAEAALNLRSRLPRGQLSVSVDYDNTRDMYVIDAL